MRTLKHVDNTLVLCSPRDEDLSGVGGGGVHHRRLIANYKRDIIQNYGTRELSPPRSNEIPNKQC